MWTWSPTRSGRATWWAEPVLHIMVSDSQVGRFQSGVSGVPVAAATDSLCSCLTVTDPPSAAPTAQIHQPPSALGVPMGGRGWGGAAWLRPPAAAAIRRDEVFSFFNTTFLYFLFDFSGCVLNLFVSSEVLYMKRLCTAAPPPHTVTPPTSCSDRRVQITATFKGLILEIDDKPSTCREVTSCKCETGRRCR